MPLVPIKESLVPIKEGGAGFVFLLLIFSSDQNGAPTVVRGGPGFFSPTFNFFDAAAVDAALVVCTVRFELTVDAL